MGPSLPRPLLGPLMAAWGPAQRPRKMKRKRKGMETLWIVTNSASLTLLASASQYVVGRLGRDRKWWERVAQFLALLEFLLWERWEVVSVPGAGAGRVSLGRQPRLWALKEHVGFQRK